MLNESSNSATDSMEMLSRKRTASEEVTARRLPLPPDESVDICEAQPILSKASGKTDERN
jgi:hypothetical protein